MAKSHQLAGVIAFLSRDAWRDSFEDVLDQHVAEALETLDIDFDEMEAALGSDWTTTLWGCAFEDFLTRTFEPDGRNLVDDYLKRRGFKEAPRTKAYLRGLRHSVMSLYEVSEIDPGESVLARDLIRGGEPIRIREKTATRSLKPWDRIAARVVDDGQGHVFGGGLLPCSQDTCELVFNSLAAAAEIWREQEGTADDADPSVVDKEFLRRMAPLFTASWLLDAVPVALGENQPEIRNADGEPLLFHDLRFPLARGVRRDTIVRRLGADAGLRRESDAFWNWLGEPLPGNSTSDGDAKIVTYEVTMDDGQAVLGTVEIQGRDLVLMVNSAARAERGRELLTGLLGDSLGAPDVRVRTMEEMRAESSGEASDIGEVPPEIATPMIHELLESRYRKMLDEPLPFFDGLSPREAAKTATGRLTAVEWLKLIENSAAGHSEDDPLRTYDLEWLWRELGVEKLRR